MLEKLIQEIRKANGPLNVHLELNYIEGGIRLLVEAIKEATVPITLLLSSSNITIEDLSSLAEAMKQVQNEFTLCLADTRIGIKGMSLLIEGMKEAKVPLFLSLDGNNLGDEGARLLGDAIKDVRLPLNLCLSSNYIRVEGASSLADGIKQASGSLSICLSGNSVGNAGAMSFAIAIREKEVPLDLCLSSNSIGKEGIKQLAAAIEHAKSPITLDVSGNNIGYTSAALLAKAIRSARTPVALDWSVERGSAIGRRVVCRGGICSRMLRDATADNFVVDARKDPSKFLARTGLNLCRKMLERGLLYPAVLAMLITSYISDEDLAWTEVATIRAVEGASQDNKYYSINYELLNSFYFNAALETQQSMKMISISGVAVCNKQKEGNLTLSAIDVIEKYGNKNPNDVEVEESNLSSCSSSPSSCASHSEYDGGMQQLKLSSQRHVMSNYLSNYSEAIHYVNEQTLYINNDKDCAAETLLMTFFTWIKDLPKTLQQQIVSSFAMQQVLGALEEVIEPSKFIFDQLSIKQPGEIFATEYQSYYEQYDFADSSTKYAQMGQDNIAGFIK